jgi:hypothetical protein
MDAPNGFSMSHTGRVNDPVTGDVHAITAILRMTKLGSESSEFPK